jgi:hypothetical protein
MNDTSTAAQALLALSRSSTARTQVARLRELLPEIEAAQAAGVKHQHILESLNAHGFALSMKAYSVMLYRLRQARAKNPEMGVAAAAPPSVARTPAAAAAAAAAAKKTTQSPSPAASPTDPKPGEPKRFDWDTLKNTPPQW